jgi:hypothetical protein
VRCEVFLAGRVLQIVSEINAPNFGNGTIEAILQDFDDLGEESAVGYEDAAEVE